MSMIAQMVHLHPRQKEALQAIASKKGSSLAAEVREAIDNYLEGASEVIPAYSPSHRGQGEFVLERSQGFFGIGGAGKGLRTQFGKGFGIGLGVF